METVTNIATKPIETVTNIASAASRAIWGDGSAEDKTKDSETLGKEPVAGEVGDVKKGEPYDKGNAEENPTTGTTSNKSSADPTTVSVADPKITASSMPAKGAILLDSENEKTGISSLDNPRSVTSSEPTASQTEPSTVQSSLKQHSTESKSDKTVDDVTSGTGTLSLDDKPREGGGIITSGIAVGETDGSHKELSSASVGRTSETKSNFTEAATTTKPAEVKTPIIEPKKSTDISSSSASPSASTPEKKSLKEKIGLDKIKAKLHKHKD